VYRGSSVKWCQYSCSAKCKGGKDLLVNVGAPGYETGRGQVCDGAVVDTMPTMDGDLVNYAKGYIDFTVDTSGLWGAIDWFRYPSELRNGLQKAEQAGCCGGQ